MPFDLLFFDDDDRDPHPDAAIALIPDADTVPRPGEGITLQTTGGTRRYRVIDIDHGYIAAPTTEHPNRYTPSTKAVYVVDPDDPRRLGQ